MATLSRLDEFEEAFVIAIAQVLERFCSGVDIQEQGGESDLLRFYMKTGVAVDCWYDRRELRFFFVHRGRVYRSTDIPHDRPNRYVP